MLDIYICCEYMLGLVKVCELVWVWVEKFEDKFQMVSIVVEGKMGDWVEFMWFGVSGMLEVMGMYVELCVKFGFLLGVFKVIIESEIQKELDKLLMVVLKKQMSLWFILGI